VTDSVSSKPAARNWLGLLFAIPLFAMSMLCDHFGIFQYFWASVISITAMSFAIWENRSYHTEIWFWVTLLVFALLHIFLIEVIAEHKWLMSIGHGTGGGVAGIALVDGLIITAVIRFPDWITSSLQWIFSADSKGTVTK
jgi:hypothetical protein